MSLIRSSAVDAEKRVTREADIDSDKAMRGEAC